MSSLYFHFYEFSVNIHDRIKIFLEDILSKFANVSFKGSNSKQVNFSRQACIAHSHLYDQIKVRCTSPKISILECFTYSSKRRILGSQPVKAHYFMRWDQQGPRLVFQYRNIPPSEGTAQDSRRKRCHLILTSANQL